MIATKTLLLMVMGLAWRENGGKAKNCRVLAKYIGILKKTGCSRRLFHEEISNSNPRGRDDKIFCYIIDRPYYFWPLNNNHLNPHTNPYNISVMQRISLVSLGNRGTNRKLSKECFMLSDAARHIFLHRIFVDICSSSLCTDPSFPPRERGLYIGYAKENWSETDGIDYLSDVFTLLKFNTSCCTCHESCERALVLCP